MTRRAVLVLALVSALTGCSAAGGPAPDDGAARAGKPGDSFTMEDVAAFDQPWAMVFLPDARALVTQRSGALLLVDPVTGSSTRVGGTPDVVVDGQGGLGDVILGPNFAMDRAVYLSWIEAGEDGGDSTGAVVGRATLRADDSPVLEDLNVIWRQEPKVSGSGHFSHRLVFSPDGRHLFVSSGDRQKFDPAQDLRNNLGTIVRLTPEGAPAAGNPITDRGAAPAQIWSYGHRNALGLAFDADGNLWSSEMGPQGGDEINLIGAGKNYGWPKASNGSHYGGADIPDHASGDGFEAPKVWWTPSVSPGSLMIYSGERFAEWKGDAFVGALSGQALIRVQLDGTNAVKADQWDMGARIREVEQGPDGALWLLTDGGDGRLLKLTPKT